MDGIEDGAEERITWIIAKAPKRPPIICPCLPSSGFSTQPSDSFKHSQIKSLLCSRFCYGSQSSRIKVPVLTMPFEDPCDLPRTCFEFILSIPASGLSTRPQAHCYLRPLHGWPLCLEECSFPQYFSCLTPLPSSLCSHVT